MKNPTNSLDNYKVFIDDVFQKLKDIGIDPTSYEIDHLGYRAITNEEYYDVKEKLTSIGEFLSEVIIKNRPIGIFKLNDPLEHNVQKIWYIEVLAPAEGDTFNSGLEHVEFIVNEELETFMNSHSNVNWNLNCFNREICPELIIDLPDKVAAKFKRISLIKARELQEKLGKL